MEAENAIVRARESQTRHNAVNDQEVDTTGNSEDEGDDASLTDDNSVASEPAAEQALAPTKGKQLQRDTSVAQDVMARKGFYGRFTNKWFSKGGWTADSRRSEGTTSEEDLTKTPKYEQAEPAPVRDEGASAKVASKEAEGLNERDGAELSNEPPAEIADVEPPPGEEVPLLPKLLTVAKFFFSSKSFYFSYDYDLSRDISKQAASISSVPLFKSFDPLVRFNANHTCEPTLIHPVVFLEQTSHQPIRGRRSEQFRHAFDSGLCRSTRVLGGRISRINFPSSRASGICTRLCSCGYARQASRGFGFAQK